MDFHSNLEYLCRVCAANTRGKNSVAECVYILKTPGLKDKLDKFLYLKIFDKDALPKVLCKTCFRQVDATASLSKIAAHTQQVFRDFLLSNLPKGPPETTKKMSEKSTSESMNKSIDVENPNKDDNEESSSANKTLAQLSTQAASVLIPAQVKPVAAQGRKEEVVVNVSVSDPLTRDNQQKMISNSQRRQSILMESRYTPKSIAQKTPATIQKVITPQPVEAANTTNNSNNYKKITTPKLQHFPPKIRQTKKVKQMPPTTTHITTYSSGGYVIGHPTTNNDQQEIKKIQLPLATTVDNVLQQKRKNLVKALNNIKANNSGQVSLLKSSQQKQQPEAGNQNSNKTPLAEVVNQATDDELPEKIIIAAPKNKLLEKTKGKAPLNLSGKQQVIPAIPAIPQMPTTTATITPVIPQTEQLLPFGITSIKPGFPDDILLGRVIRDMDLLKLILKALKWPVNNQNMELQLQRLKNTKFTEIMSDVNLLQDTDLTQLLGPYLAPVFLAAQVLQQQQHQQQQLLKDAAMNQQQMAAAFLAQAQAQAAKPMSAMEAAQAEISKSIPYKLPPETSVQLVPATSEEAETRKSSPLTKTSFNPSKNLKRDGQMDKPAEDSTPTKRQRRAAAQKARDSIVISDEEDNESEEEVMPKPKQRSTKAGPHVQIELNSNLISQFNLLNGSSSGNDANAALMALLERQKTAVVKNKNVQKRRRNSISSLVTLPPSEFDALIDLDDDIVLMEPVTTTSSSDTITTSNSLESTTQKNDALNPFLIPSVPLITRPIIKRRKTVIHSSRERFDFSIDLRDKEQTMAPTSSVSPAKEKQIEETITQVSPPTTNQSTVVPNETETPKNNTVKETLTKSPTAGTSLLKVSHQKKLQSKAALGQQLLEAIGLQKLSTKANMSAPQTEAATSSSAVPSTITVLPSAKQSINQIRTALKKSLKQAQEQQQQRKKELCSSTTNTIIQDADSTTKSVLKKIVVVEGKGNNAENCSSIVDVEEQIDKVTLMVRSNDNEQGEQLSTNTATTEKEDKKEFKISSITKVQDKSRSLLSPIVSRKIAAIRNSEAFNSNEQSLKDKEKDTEDNKETEIKEEINKSEKEESTSPNIPTTVNATNVVAKDHVPTQKRRGRKRNIDKQNEIEAAIAKDEKEKDNKTTTTTSNDNDTESTNGANKKEEDEATANRTPSRPTRQSKTLSKYYKGPDKPTQGKRFLPSRTTRNRKYS